MCLIRVLTRCGPFVVCPITLCFTSRVKKEGLLRSCFRPGVKVRLLKRLGFVLRCAVAIQSSLSPLQVKKEEVHDTHDVLMAVWLLNCLRLLLRSELGLLSVCQDSFRTPVELQSQ